MNQWEYMLIPLSDSDTLESKLNELGAEGWEVVAYVGYQQLDSIVLKRPRQKEPDEGSEEIGIF